ncbi:NAD(P)H-binding protein [Erythrobacter litoralis]|uniref:NAD(P)-binding domain-containing protein n=1 Tax=Erythrobacter litoralis (strain HTCC2594) TaxID=314225 RepID=Q2N9L0_ERYLH|nr:NAD(P)H-binding protein [Erythrobacter litoralis]ABC63631.1 hypothetical protein ELI_07695 [Erythrobacter litoralis HTCC2594]
MSKTLLLFGASGGTGREILAQALDRGWKVRGAERDFPDGFCDHSDFEPRAVDLLDDDLGDVVEGVDAVISAIGLGRDPRTLLDPPPLYTEGTRNICIAMRGAGVRRLLAISAAFADPNVTIPAWFEASIAPLSRIFSQMANMEMLLGREPDIDWTAVRPGWLLDRPHTGEFKTAMNDLPEGTLRTRRADLAHFMLDCVEHDLHVRAKPFVAAPEEEDLEAPAALVEELLPA